MTFLNWLLCWARQHPVTVLYGDGGGVFVWVSDGLEGHRTVSLAGVAHSLKSAANPRSRRSGFGRPASGTLVWVAS